MGEDVADEPDAIARLDGRLVPFATFDNGEWDHPWPEADQASDSPLVIDAISSIPDRTILTGWVVPDTTGQLSLKNHGILLTDCDGNVRRTARALAALHVSDRLFWILQEHGYEDETYVVVEITAAGVHRQREAAGGGC